MRLAIASSCVLFALTCVRSADARETSGPAAAAIPVRMDLTEFPNREPAPARDTDPVLSVVQVALNGNLHDEPVFVAELGDELFIPVDILSTQHIQSIPTVRKIGGLPFVPARSLGAESVMLDATHETLKIQCSTDCFDETFISSHSSRSAELSPVAAGAFINYDVFVQNSDIESRTGALLEAGVFSSYGTGVANVACTSGDDGESCIRLDTTWTIDRTTSATRLQLGDSITHAASWGAPARFGGIRWGTDFSLVPDFISFPTPSISGDATLPGVVDVIVNDTQRFSTEVPAGHFTLSDLPIMTGAGTTQLVLTDVLGRQSVIVADYYSAPQLLMSGLKEWSVDAGFLREDFGLSSSRYDQGFIAGSYARGLSDAFTFATRAEIGGGQQTAGISGAVLSPAMGVLQIAAAMSNGGQGTGELIDVRHEWRSPSFSVGTSVTYSSEQYRVFGQDRMPPRITARTFANFSDQDLGAVSIAWTHRDERTQEDFSTLGLRYTKTLGQVSLNVSAQQMLGTFGETTAAISLSIPLGGGVSSGMGTSYQSGKLDGHAHFRRSADPADGLGYSARTSIGSTERYEASAEYRSRIGDVSAMLSQVNDRSASRLSLRGGAAMIDGAWIAAPSITDSIAVVTVGQQPGIHVYQDRQPVGVTDSHGRVVLTRLHPFERNTISFDPRDASLNSQFETMTQDVVPGLRTGHTVRFDTTQSRSVLAYVVDVHGDPVSSQGRISDAETGTAYPIGQDGRIFITDAKPVSRLKFVHDRLACEARIELAPVRQLAPYEDVGNIVCIPMTKS